MQRYIERMKRFAGLYMNEEPEAPNYDPERKLIKSIWNGKQRPHAAQRRPVRLGGRPGAREVPPPSQRRGPRQVLDLETWYPKMLAHCAEYLDSVGDNPLNLAATTLALNAYALTGETKYRDWIKDYAGAWKQRTEACGGNIPSNVGLDGTPGGEYKGQWWKGTYGWNFTIFDGEIEKIAHRNNFEAGSWPGFRRRVAGDRRPGFIDVVCAVRWTTSSRIRRRLTEGCCCRGITETRAATKTTARRSGTTTSRILRLAPHRDLLWSRIAGT
jgi:hypothetical protein